MTPLAVIILILTYGVLVVVAVFLQPLDEGDRVRDRYGDPAGPGTIERRWSHTALVVWDSGKRTMHNPDHLRRIKT